MRTMIVIGDEEMAFCSELGCGLERSTEFMVAKCCNCGVEVLSFASKNQVDIVIINQSLPDISGLNCIARLRNDHPHLGALMIAESFDSAVLIRGLAAGVDGFLIRTATFSEYS